MNPHMPVQSPPSTSLRSDSVVALAKTATRDVEYWMEDGDVIILSRKGKGVMFKVRKRRLAQSSGLFTDTFNDAKPGEFFENRPIVGVDDPPHELREMFRLVFPLNLHDRHPTTVNMSSISNILRLGDKYRLAEDLLEEDKNHLTTYYTRSFAAWADRHNAVGWQPEPLDAIHAINLSRLVGDIPSVLPTAFYVCATIDPEELRYGSALENGSTRETLALEDQLLVAQLRSCLIAENAKNAFLLFQAPSARIWPRKKCCSKVWTKLLRHAGLPVAAHHVSSAQALESWVVNVDSLVEAGPTVRSTGLRHQRTSCNRCRTKLQERDRELREQVWFKLPQILSIRDVVLGL